MKTCLYNPFKRVEFNNPSALRFYGRERFTTDTPFRILDANGQDTGYIGSFNPGELATDHLVEVRRAAFVDAFNNDTEPAYTPVGLCLNTRIVAALMHLSYPNGRTPADFKAIDNAVVNKATLPLPSLEDAENWIRMHQGIEFDNYALANDYLSRQVEAFYDESNPRYRVPEPEMIP